MNLILKPLDNTTKNSKVNNCNFDHLILKPDLRFPVREREIRDRPTSSDSRTDNVQGAILVFS